MLGNHNHNLSDMLLLGFVAVAVLVALVLLFRSRRRVQQRCPACHRMGHGPHYGRFCCSSCGAHFVLDATGRPNRTVWDVVYAPLSILLLVVAYLAVALLTAAPDLPSNLIGSLILVALSSWELRQAFRKKRFTNNDVA